MGFWSNLKKDFHDAKIYVDANKNPFSKESREVRKRTLMNLDLETGKPNLEAVDTERIKNIRNSMQKYDIEHPETIESIEQKIDEIHIQLKNSSDKQQRLNLLHELDYLYDKLEELNNKKELHENNIDKNYEK